MFTSAATNRARRCSLSPMNDEHEWCAWRGPRLHLTKAGAKVPARTKMTRLLSSRMLRVVTFGAMRENDASARFVCDFPWASRGRGSASASASARAMGGAHGRAICRVVTLRLCPRWLPLAKGGAFSQGRLVNSDNGCRRATICCVIATVSEHLVNGRARLLPAPLFSHTPQ